MKIIKVENGQQEAFEILQNGGIVGLPTETVYGLAADATNKNAVKKIYEAKKRPRENPLIVHVADVEMAMKYAELNNVALKLVEKFWEGPLTLVVPKKNCEPEIVSEVNNGGQLIAIRQPKGIVKQLAKQLGKPLAAPSANMAGKLSPTTAQHVAERLGKDVSLVLDGGECQWGIESTIVKVVGEEITLLRLGAVDYGEIEKVMGGEINKKKENGNIEAPGEMKNHYAPDSFVRLNAKDAKENESLLCFGKQTEKHNVPCLNLSEKGCLREAARNLFAMMYELDKNDTDTIAVQTIPENGENGNWGKAINDRLKRAVKT